MRLCIMHNVVTPENNQRFEIAKQFATGEPIVRIEAYGNGRINETYLAAGRSGGRYVLQKLSRIFAPSVLFDIAEMTAAMKRAGFLTTELILTKDGKLGLEQKNPETGTIDVWRMLTFIPGRTIEAGIKDAEAREAMRLIGAFHHAFAEHPYEFRHVRDGFHDTPKIMRGLRETIDEYRGTRKHEALAALGEQILDAYNAMPHAWAYLPKRVIHGDPKLNNVRFDEHSTRAIALIDLDTMGRHSAVVDIADAARSWANTAPEDNADESRFDLNIFRTMMEGYSERAAFLTEEERQAIPNAIAQIALELAARFVTDAYRESYFTLDRTNYPDLFTQNSVKARAQFALSKDVLGKLGDIERLL